jgi:hypothetical protein
LPQIHDEQSRHGHDGGTRLDGQRCGRVTQVVRSDLQAEGLNRGIEDVTTIVAVSKGSSEVQDATASDVEPVARMRQCGVGRADP